MINPYFSRASIRFRIRSFRANFRSFGSDDKIDGSPVSSAIATYLSKSGTIFEMYVNQNYTILNTRLKYVMQYIVIRN